MSDLEEFIDAIIQHPLDNQYRLVFADYLEEMGDPRAELVRVQLEMSELPRLDKRRAALRKKELKLFREHGAFRKVPKLAKVLSYHGGFINAIEITVTRFMKLQDEIFNSCPITEVTLTGGPTRLVKVAESAHLEKLAVLRLQTKDAKPEHLLPVVRSPHLERLQTLFIYSNFMSVEVLEALSQETHATDLQDLEVGGRNEDDTVVIIGSSPKIDGLSRFACTLNAWSRSSGAQQIIDSAFESLAGSSVYRKLETLELNCASRERHVEQLLHSRCGATLHTLKLQNASLGRGMRNVFPNLRELTVSGANNNEVLVDVAENYRDLELLDLSYCDIGDHGAEAMAASPLLKNIQKLYLTGNRITIRGAQALGNSPYRAKGQKFYLRSNRFTQKHVEQLKNEFGKTFGNLGEYYYYSPF